MCLYPKLIKNKRYQSNKKNGGNVPVPRDERELLVPIGCGKCIECRRQKKNNWLIRLIEEVKYDKECTFVTLTFREEELKKLSQELKNFSYIIDNDIATLAVRRFLERWRKKYKKSVKHFLITELGHEGTERIHLHGIIWSKNRTEIERTWGYGYVFCGQYVNEKTINYITKYITKIDEQHKTFEPKILCSKGIGANYVGTYNYNKNKFKGEETEENYINSKGYKMNLPIYYRNKIYSEDERTNLWIQKLDKQKRYVLGNEIDISVSEDEYYKTLEYYQKLNKKLGFGDNSETWDKKMYKHERKLLRIKKASGHN